MGYSCWAFASLLIVLRVQVIRLTQRLDNSCSSLCFQNCDMEPQYHHIPNRRWCMVGRRRIEHMEYVSHSPLFALSSSHVSFASKDLAVVRSFTGLLIDNTN